METNFTSVPIAGCIKHGVLENNRPKELGYFIARVENNAMKDFSDTFNKLYSKTQELIIYVLNEDACTLRRVKRNQSGIMCYCSNNTSKAKEKVNKAWVEKDCLESCESRQAKENQKPLCQQELTLKFLIPTIAQDRCWLFQTKSFYTIQKITSYLNFQKQLGNPIKGYYKLFLSTKISETNGKKFTNYVVDIMKASEDSNNTPNLSQTNSTKADIPTLESTQTEPIITKPIQQDDTNIKPNKKTASKKISTEKTKKDKPEKAENVEAQSETTQITDEDMNNYYILLETSNIELTKQGKQIPYIQGKFINKQDKEVEIILHPDFANEIAECELRKSIFT